MPDSNIEDPKLSITTDDNDIAALLPHDKLKAQHYQTEDIDAVLEGLAGSGNLNYLSLQSSIGDDGFTGLAEGLIDRSVLDVATQSNPLSFRASDFDAALASLQNANAALANANSAEELAAFAATFDMAGNQQLFEELNKHKSSFSLIETCKVQFRTPEQALALAAFLANCFDEPDRVMTGIAELMLNAIEHGNLGFGFEAKKRALQDGTWDEIVARKLQSPSCIGKKAEAVLTHKDDGTYLVITDEGNGFDWRDYMMIDPTRAGERNGRGIATARTLSFDRMGYNDVGNQVMAYAAPRSELSWQ